MFKKELDAIAKDETKVAQYHQGMSALWQSGVLLFPRTYGRVFMQSRPTIDGTALDGAYAAGFQDCLDTLMNFKEYFLTQKPDTTSLSPTYGALKLAVVRGDLTQDEVDGLKRPGTPSS